MKYKLILLKDSTNILVIDEEIPYNRNGGTNGNFFCFSEVLGNIQHGVKEGDKMYISPFVKNVGNCKSCRKIIAGIDSLPTLTYSDEVKQVLIDKYGWVDVEELAIENNPEIQIYKNDTGLSKSVYISAHKNFTDGFKAHQSITNKMFSLEDVNKLVNSVTEFLSHHEPEEFEDWYNKKIELLQQPIQLDVEIDIEEIGGDNVENSNKKQIYYNEPKITNNSVLITKILK